MKSGWQLMHFSLLSMPRAIHSVDAQEVWRLFLVSTIRILLQNGKYNNCLSHNIPELTSFSARKWIIGGQMMGAQGFPQMDNVSILSGNSQNMNIDFSWCPQPVGAAATGMYFVWDTRATYAPVTCSYRLYYLIILYLMVKHCCNVRASRNHSTCDFLVKHLQDAWDSCVTYTSLVIA